MSKVENPEPMSSKQPGAHSVPLDSSIQNNSHPWLRACRWLLSIILASHVKMHPKCGSCTWCRNACWYPGAISCHAPPPLSCCHMLAASKSVIPGMTLVVHKVGMQLWLQAPGRKTWAFLVLCTSVILLLMKWYDFDPIGLNTHFSSNESLNF